MTSMFVRSRPVPRLARLGAVVLVLLAAACESPEDRIAGTFERVWKAGVTPEPGIDGEPDRHVLILHPDRTWTTEHPEESLQQFDVPMGRGTWTLNGVTLTIAPTDLGPMQYTVNGDTLFPRTPRNARMAETMTGVSMNIGVDTYLLRAR